MLWWKNPELLIPRQYRSGSIGRASSFSQSVLVSIHGCAGKGQSWTSLRNLRSGQRGGSGRARVLVWQKIEQVMVANAW